MPVRADEKPQTAAGRESWRLLDECEGFRVDSPDGCVGVVEAVRFDGSPRRPSALVVRSGLFNRRGLLVPIEGIERVLPSSKRIVLGSSPALLQPGSAGGPLATH